MGQLLAENGPIIRNLTAISKPKKLYHPLENYFPHNEIRDWRLTGANLWPPNPQSPTLAETYIFTNP
jgi:hypothetical protein